MRRIRRHRTVKCNLGDSRISMSDEARDAVKHLIASGAVLSRRPYRDVLSIRTRSTGSVARHYRSCRGVTYRKCEWLQLLSFFFQTIKISNDYRKLDSLFLFPFVSFLSFFSLFLSRIFLHRNPGWFFITENWKHGEQIPRTFPQANWDYIYSTLPLSPHPWRSKYDVTRDFGRF